MNFEITINLDKKCVRCGKGGAMASGICLTCAAKMIKSGEIDVLKKKKGKRK